MNFGLGNFSCYQSELDALLIVGIVLQYSLVIIYV